MYKGDQSYVSLAGACVWHVIDSVFNLRLYRNCAWTHQQDIDIILLLLSTGESLRLLEIEWPAVLIACKCTMHTYSLIHMYVHTHVHSQTHTNTHASCTTLTSYSLAIVRKPSKLYNYHACGPRHDYFLLYTESIIFPSPNYIYALQNHDLEYSSAFLCFVYVHQRLTTSLEGLSISVAYHWSGKKWQGIEWQTTQVCYCDELGLPALQYWQAAGTLSTLASTIAKYLGLKETLSFTDVVTHVHKQIKWCDRLQKHTIGIRTDLLPEHSALQLSLVTFNLLPGSDPWIIFGLIHG